MLCLGSITFTINMIVQITWSVTQIYYSFQDVLQLTDSKCPSQCSNHKVTGLENHSLELIGEGPNNLDADEYSMRRIKCKVNLCIH